MEKLSVKTHPDYDTKIVHLLKIRHCVEGPDAVKAERYTYLPHPSQIDQDSAYQRARYDEYLSGAEFDSGADDLRRSLLGKMRCSKAQSEVPDSLKYMVENVDGDGMSLAAAIEYAVNNCLQTKWHLLVADYKGAAPDGVELSIAQRDALNARATIKQYTRENVIDWHFSVANGVMQLSFLRLLEMSCELDYKTGDRVEVESYLTLALDENGDYYQQKSVYKKQKLVEEGEPSYPKVGGIALKWLPISILSDEELPINSLPRQLGYINAACDMALYAYRVSADYKETQRNFKVTFFNSGWKRGDREIFKENNHGRDYVMIGGVNNLPEGVTADVISSSSNMDDYHWYFAQYQEKINALGGRDQKSGAMTATEANIISADQNALLDTLATNVEMTFSRLLSYCAMFEGLWGADSVETAINDGLVGVDMPRDFATQKLTEHEQAQIVANWQVGLISKAEAQRQFAQGGVLIEELDAINKELEQEQATINAQQVTQDDPAPVAQTTNEAVPK